MGARNCPFTFFCIFSIIVLVFLTPQLSAAVTIQQVELINVYCREQEDWTGKDDLQITALVQDEICTMTCNGDCTDSCPIVYKGRNERIVVKIGAGETKDLGGHVLYRFEPGGSGFTGFVKFHEIDRADPDDPLPPHLELSLGTRGSQHAEHRFARDGYDYTLRYRIVSWALEANSDRFGGDYRDFATNEVQQCQAACSEEGNCRSFTFAAPGTLAPGGRCWLKDSVASRGNRHHC